MQVLLWGLGGNPVYKQLAALLEDDYGDDDGEEDDGDDEDDADDDDELYNLFRKLRHLPVWILTVAKLA